MHSSPYLSHSGYGQRTYGRSNSSGGGYGFGDSTLGSYNNTSDGLSSYYRSKYIIPEDGPAKSFLAPRYTPSSVATGYQLNRYKSSDNVPDSSYLSDYKLKKSTSATSFLPSNTHSLLKNYNSGETTSRQLPISQLRSRYIDNLHSPTDTSKPFMNKKLDDRKFAGKYGGGGESTYASAYLTRINKGRDSKPREIDTRDINVTEKPKNPKWLTTDRRRDDEGGTISRNRQVVRLTIKREKVEPEDPFTIRNKTLQTMAQRLIDKYQVPVKKQYEPETLVKRRLPYQRLPSPKDEKPLILPLTKISRTPNPVSSAAASTTTAAAAVPEIAVPVLQTRPATQITPKDPPLALQSPQRLKTTTSAEEKDDDAALVLQRATATAETKDKLESWQEVKDAIYAAVLHPDVDIESDEEIDKLMKGGEKSSPEGSKKDKDTKREAESRRGDGDDDEDVEEREGKREEKGGGGGGEEGRRGETSDSLKGKGKAIVGQLKKFVRQQESTNRSRKKRSKKRSSRGSRGSRKGDGEEKSSGMAKDNLVGKTSDKDGVVVETEKPLIPPPSTSTSTTNTSDRLVEERCEKKNTDRVKDSSLTQDPDDKTMTKEEAKVSVADKGKNAVKEKKDSLLSPDIVMKTVKKKPKVTKTIKDGVGEEAGDTTDKDKESQASKYTNRKDSRSLLSADLVLDNLALGNESRDGEESNAKGKEAEASGEKLPQAGKFEKTPAGLPEGKKDQSSDTQSTKIPKIKWKLKKTTTTTTTTEDEKETTSETLQKQSGGFPDGPPPSLLPISSSSSPTLSQSSISPPLPSTTSAPSLFSSTFATGEKQTNSKQKDEHQTGANTTWDKQQTDVKSVNEEQTGIIPEGKMKDVNKDTVGWRRQAGINKLQPLADPDNNNKTSSVAAKPSSIPRKTEESAKMNVGAPWRIKKEDKATTLKEKDEGEREYYTRKPLQETDTTKPQVKDDDDNKNKEFYTRTPVDNKLIKPKLNSSSVPDEDNSNKEEKVPEKKIPAWKISRKAIQEKSATQPTTTTTTYKDKVSNRTLEKEQKTATPSDRTEADNRTDSKTDTTTTTTTTTTTSSGEGEERGGGGVEEKDVRNDEVSKLRGDREGQNKVTIKDLKGKGREDSNEGEAKRDKLGLPPRPDTTPVKKALKRPRQVVPPPAPKEDATNELLKARSILKRPNKQSISAKKETGGATGAPDQSSSGETTTTTTTVPWRKPVAPLVPSNQGEQIQGARNILKPPVKPKADSKPAEQEDDKVLDSKAKLSAKKDERKQDERENEKVKKTESSKPAEESVEEKQEATPKVKKLGVKKSATGVPSESPVTAAGKEPMKLEPRGRPLRKQVLSPSSAAARTRSISSSSSSSSSFFSSSSDSEDGYEANSTVRKKVEKPRRPLKARAAAGVTGKAAPQSPKSSSSSSLLGGSLYKKKITDTTTSPVPTTTAKTATLAKTTKPSVAENAKQNNKDATTAKEDEKKDTELSTGVVLPRQEAEEGGAGGEVRAAASQSADSGYGSCPSTPQPTHTAPDPKEEQEEEVVVEEEVKVEVEVEVVEEEQCTDPLPRYPHSAPHTHTATLSRYPHSASHHSQIHSLVTHTLPHTPTHTTHTGRIIRVCKHMGLVFLLSQWVPRSHYRELVL
ncbi:hypothetical protein Pmani_032501 [Petrolisthes manimaculis]|uniref:Uncharacterized protein n=1 Tax=Petrolisthes manimaculis TaxID=1843537 RepID=A0AAE1NTI6_9EUCA|nr:hypothetical protein Pmani_032501 [Petrolisthes manimaculis]